MSKKSGHARLPKAGKHRAAHTHLHRPKMSVIGKSAFAGGAGDPAGPPMAFPAVPNGGGPAFGAPPDLSGGGGAPPPMMGPGGGPPEQ